MPLFRTLRLEGCISPNPGARIVHRKTPVMLAHLRSGQLLEFLRWKGFMVQYTVVGVRFKPRGIHCTLAGAHSALSLIFATSSPFRKVIEEYCPMVPIGQKQADRPVGHGWWEHAHTYMHIILYMYSWLFPPRIFTRRRFGHPLASFALNGRRHVGNLAW